MKDKYSIGIGFNLFDVRAILLRGDGKIVMSIERKRGDVDANQTIEMLLDLFEEIISKAKKYENQIEGVGFALGGIIDKKRGIMHWPQEIDSSCVYISVPLKKYFQDKFKLPIVIENDSSACAWAEYVTNYSNYSNIIYMFSGVGCGIVIDGSLYGGRDGASGELFVNPHTVMQSPLGDFSFLAPWPADMGAVKKAKQLISLGKNTSLIKRITSTGNFSLEDILIEARNKDRVSRDLLKEIVFCLGVKLSFLVNLINPEAVIIGGGLEEAGDFLLEEINRVVRNFSFSEMRKNLKINFSRLGRTATSLGAGLLVFKENSLHKDKDML